LDKFYCIIDVNILKVTIKVESQAQARLFNVAVKEVEEQDRKRAPTVS